MVRPQNEDLNRSGTTPLDPDSIGGRLEANDRPQSDDRTGGPVPPENRPGHHPEVDQDKPDGDAFVARFSGHDDTEEPNRRADFIDQVKSTASTASRVTAAFFDSARRVGRVTVDAIREEVANRAENDDATEET